MPESMTTIGDSFGRHRQLLPHVVPGLQIKRLFKSRRYVATVNRPDAPAMHLLPRLPLGANARCGYRLRHPPRIAKNFPPARGL
jgi:hypothetical protein